MALKDLPNSTASDRLRAKAATFNTAANNVVTTAAAAQIKPSALTTASARLRAKAASVNSQKQQNVYGQSNSVKAVESIWDRHDGTSKTTSGGVLDAPKSYNSVGRGDHTPPQSASTKPLAGFAAGVQANNAGYKAMAQKKVDKTLNEPEQPLTGFAAGVQANNEGYRQLAEDNAANGKGYGNYLVRKAVGGGMDIYEGLGNAFGYAQQGIAKGAEMQAANAMKAAASTTKSEAAKAALTPLAEAQQKTALKDLKTPTETYFNFADEYMAKTEELHADKDYGFVGHLVGDVAQGVGGEVAKLPLRLAPGLNEIAIFISSFGNAMQSAKKEGKSDGEALPYAFATAAVELATEEMLGFADLTGKGGLDDAVEKGIKAISSNPAVQKALRIIAGGTGEGFEEFIAGITEGYINKVTIKTDERTFGETLKDSLYDALVGGITGVVVSTANVISSGYGKLPTANEIEELTTQVAGETVSSIAAKAAVLGGNAEAKSTDGNTRLTENDITEYVATGERQHVRNGKEAQIRSGESPILTTPASIVGFIKDALTGKRRNVIKAYGRVGQRFSTDVYAKSEGAANISGYYMELDANKLAHMKDHLETDGDLRNIPLTEDQLMHLPDYIDNYDDVIDVVRRKDGSVRIMLGKKINGHTIIVETVSKGRKSVHPVTAYQIPTEWYNSFYKPKAATTNTSQTANAAESGYKAITASVDNIPQAKNEVNGKTANEPSTFLYLERLAEQAEKSGNLYTQRILQTEIEKARKSSHTKDVDASTPMSTIYADYMREYNMPDDYEAETENGEGFEELNADLENDANSDIIFTGAIWGAYNDKNDPKHSKRDAYAKQYYSTLRNSNRDDIVLRVAVNADADIASVEKMYAHLFVNKYLLDEGYKSFDPDYDIAQSLQRLRDGKNVQEHDRILIQHEAMEYDLMNSKGMSYEEAHNITNEFFNYQEALEKWRSNKR